MSALLDIRCFIAEDLLLHTAVSPVLPSGKVAMRSQIQGCPSNPGACRKKYAWSTPHLPLPRARPWHHISPSDHQPRSRGVASIFDDLSQCLQCRLGAKRTRLGLAQSFPGLICTAGTAIDTKFRQSLLRTPGTAH